MKLYFVGAAHEVTGSCTILYACGKKIMIDCGMEQGENVYENVELPVSPNDIDAMLLTHAHIDHSGHIPYVSANGFSAPIYTTSATDRLCRIMLMDSAHIQEFECILYVLRGIKRLNRFFTASLIFSVLPFCLKFLNVRRVHKHNSA